MCHRQGAVLDGTHRGPAQPGSPRGEKPNEGGMERKQTTIQHRSPPPQPRWGPRETDTTHIQGKFQGNVENDVSCCRVSSIWSRLLSSALRQEGVKCRAGHMGPTRLKAVARFWELWPQTVFGGRPSGRAQPARGHSQ